MQRKIMGKIIASILVVVLIAGNLILIGNSMVSYAEGNLESQDEKTEHKNVEFSAYIEKEGEKVHSEVYDVGETPVISMHINVKESGFMKNGVIEIIEGNYRIKGEIEGNGIIGKKEGNRLELKQKEKKERRTTNELV